MLAATFQKPVTDVPLKKASGDHIRNNRKQYLLTPNFQTADSSAQKETTVSLQSGLLTSKIFKITFQYLDQAIHTKVLKVAYHSQQSIYKVVLVSDICKYLPICWLQQGPQGWALLLGPELDENLKMVITAAIESQELATL
jgi:hypothetical protein